MTKLEIWNAALAAIGHDRTIASESEDSAELLRCQQFWDLSRKTLLRAHPWAFAKQPYACGAAVQVRANSVAYPLPQALRICGAEDASGRRVGVTLVSGLAWVSSGTMAGGVIWYVEDVEDTELFDAEFVQALIYALGERLAFPMTGKTGLTQTMHELYRRALGEARAIDANESRPVGADDDYLEKSRS